MKQLNFRRFNTNSKKFTVTVIFFPERNKMGPEKNNMLCLVYHGVFGHLPTIPDYVMISEDYRRLTKMSEDRDIVACISGHKCEDYRRFPRRNPKILDFIFVVIFTWERHIFCSLQI